MKALIGIDAQKRFCPAIQLLSRIGFKNCRAHLLHCIPPLIDPMWPMADAAMMDSVRKSQVELGEETLRHATEALETLGISSESELRYGIPAAELISLAEEIDADIIAAGASHQGAATCFFLDSVCRGLVIGSKRSILIAKETIPEGKPLKAVLATDHSEYANRALDQFIQMSPVGIRKISVLTALQTDGTDGVVVPTEIQRISEGDSRDTVVRRMLQNVCDRLWTIRIQAEPVVLYSNPAEAINRAMAEAEASLLIMAAQGHGFFDRLLTGSLCLREAVSENHSMLVLRA